MATEDTLGWEVQGDYGQGYEMVTTEDTKQQALDTKRVYEENEPGTPFRVRREVTE